MATNYVDAKDAPNYADAKDATNYASAKGAPNASNKGSSANGETSYADTGTYTDYNTPNKTSLTELVDLLQQSQKLIFRLFVFCKLLILSRIGFSF